VPLFARDRLRPGNRLEGPAILEQMDSTTVVPPGWHARVDGFANLVLEAAA
jgi:N-methylhydantoinase A